MPDEIEISGPYERAFDILDDEHRAASLMVKSALAGRLTDHIEDNDFFDPSESDPQLSGRNRILQWPRQSDIS